MRYLPLQWRYPISVVTTLRKERSSMLMRTDPFRELDRSSQQLFGQNGT
jgi:hypothetical protein